MPPKSKQHGKGGNSSQASQSQRAQSQPGGSQGGKAAAPIERKELEDLSNNLVKYLLIMDQKKLPIKILDIKKHVLPNHGKAFPAIKAKAAEKLAKVFGIELVELQDKKGYILINKLEADPADSHLHWAAEDNSKMGLIVVILSVLFMSGNVMQDSQLWHALKKLGLDPECHHEVFGDIKKLVTTELVRQGYLEMERVPTAEQQIHEFRWGQRAKAETTKRAILNFVCEVYGNDVEPQQWTSQWQDVLTSEGLPLDTLPSSSGQ